MLSDIRIILILYALFCLKKNYGGANITFYVMAKDRSR